MSTITAISNASTAIDGTISYKLPWVANQATLSLIKHFESLHDGDLKQIGLQPKICPAGVWTEGWGRAMIDPRTGGHLRGAANKARAYQLSSIKTEAEAEVALWEDLWKLGAQRAIREIGQSAWNKLTHNQQGALASFAYNCGVGSPKYRIWANITRWLNKQMTDQQLISYWESSVIRGGGKVLAGLVRRRKSEARLFFNITLHVVK